MLKRLPEPDLVGVTTGQAVGTGDQEHVNHAARHRIPQAVQRRAVQTRAAVALVAVDMAGIHRPAVLTSVRLETIQMQGNGWLVSLPFS
jgi:hypothetical protein